MYIPLTCMYIMYIYIHLVCIYIYIYIHSISTWFLPTLGSCLHGGTRRNKRLLEDDGMLQDCPTIFQLNLGWNMFSEHTEQILEMSAMAFCLGYLT